MSTQSLRSRPSARNKPTQKSKRTAQITDRIPFVVADRERPRQQMMGSILFLAIPALLLLFTALLSGTTSSDGVIERGVSVAGVDVSGSSWDKPAAELNQYFNNYLQQPVRIVFGDQAVDVAPAQLGISIDMDATRERALGVGRGGFFSGMTERLHAHVFGTDVAPAVKIDTNAFVQTLTAVGANELHAPQDAIFMWSDGQLMIRASEDGVGIDAAAVAKDLRRSIAAGKHDPVDLHLVTLKPTVNTAAMQRIEEAARTMLAEPLVISTTDQAWQIDQPALAAMVTAKDGKIALSTAALQPVIASISPNIDRAEMPAEVIHNGNATFSTQPDVTGRKLNVDASVATIQTNLTSGKHLAMLTVDETRSSITPESLQPLLDKVNDIANRGMVVSWPDGEERLDSARFADAMMIDERTSEVAFDNDLVFKIIEPIAHAINRPATGYRWIGWEVVAPEGALPGRVVDINASVNRVVANALGGNGNTPLVVSEDKDLSELAHEVVISDLLGTASTYYGSSGYNRRVNVELAVSQLNGYLIPPGGEFSFNKAIGGTATLDDGYQMGYGIITGANGTPQTVPSIAGGICQVSTTAFQAAFWAGMQIGERNWHLYWIPSYGSGPGGMQGLDATVDPDYGLDNTWINTTDEWLAIYAVADGEWVTVELWGTSQGWTVQADDPVITNVAKADPTMVRQYNSEIPPGQTVVVEHAQDGFTASIHRTVTNASGEMIDDLWLTSYYLPSRNVTLVGEGVSLDPAPSPTPIPAVEPTATPLPEPTATPVPEVVVEEPVGEPTVATP